MGCVIGSCAPRACFSCSCGCGVFFPGLSSSLKLPYLKPILKHAISGTLVDPSRRRSDPLDSVTGREGMCSSLCTSFTVLNQPAAALAVKDTAISTPKTTQETISVATKGAKRAWEPTRSMLTDSRILNANGLACHNLSVPQGGFKEGMYGTSIAQ